MAQVADPIAYFSYNPAGIFSGGKMKGASTFSNKSEKKEEAPKPMDMPQAPKVEDIASESEETARKKRSMLAAGSKTIYSSPDGLGKQAGVIRKTLTGQ